MNLVSSGLAGFAMDMDVVAGEGGAAKVLPLLGNLRLVDTTTSFRSCHMLTMKKRLPCLTKMLLSACGQCLQNQVDHGGQAHKPGQASLVMLLEVCQITVLDNKLDKKADKGKIPVVQEDPIIEVVRRASVGAGLRGPVIHEGGQQSAG